MHLHDPHSSPCPGSNKPPLGASASTGNASFHGTSLTVDTSSSTSAAKVSASQPLTTMSTNYPDTSTSSVNASHNATSADATTVVSHPSCTQPIIKHIPKSARPACCLALADILRNITRNSSDLSAWSRLFHFAPSVLWNPPKTGSNTNLSSLIKGRISNPSLPLLTYSRVRGASSKSRSDNSLAAAVSSKIEDRNIKAGL